MFHILFPLIVVCTAHSHGLHCCSCCLGCYLDYSFSYIHFLIYHYRLLFCLLGTCLCMLYYNESDLIRMSCFAETALFESAYFVLLIWSGSACLTRFSLLTPCSVSCFIEDNTCLCLYAY